MQFKLITFLFLVAVISCGFGAFNLISREIAISQIKLVVADLNELESVEVGAKGYCSFVYPEIDFVLSENMFVLRDNRVWTWLLHMMDSEVSRLRRRSAYCSGRILELNSNITDEQISLIKKRLLALKVKDTDAEVRIEATKSLIAIKSVKALPDQIQETSEIGGFGTRLMWPNENSKTSLKTKGSNEPWIR